MSASNQIEAVKELPPESAKLIDDGWYREIVYLLLIALDRGWPFRGEAVFEMWTIDLCVCYRWLKETPRSGILVV